MRFTATPIPGAWIIDIDLHADERGFFARTLCQEEFERCGLNGRMVQQSISWNRHKGTLRGLHYQAPPYGEEKLVRVTRGSIYDVIVDLRRDSAAFRQWFGIELTESNHRQMYIPKNVAHGFLTLDDSTEVLYEMTAPFFPDAANGLRWNDPALGIQWPEPVSIISQQDQSWPMPNQLIDAQDPSTIDK